MKRFSGLLAIIVLLALPLSAAQAAALGFAPAASYALGSYPRSVAVGDFNGDGKPDLAVANPNSASLNVRWNDGDGTFDGSSVLTYAAGMRPLAVAVDDFNGDGKPDLAAANQTSHNVSVRWNDGDGTFDDHLANYVMGSYPTFVAAGDFNGDGKPDLATANYGSEDVSVRWNDGDGTFDDHLAAYSAGAGANSVAVGDFNGDDKPDLAIANYDGGTVSVRWNDGDGTFDDHLATYYISGYPDSVAVGDFNGDGKLDLATANDMGYTVSVLWNDGDGTFDDHPATYSAGARPVAVAVDDFNGDGKPDLAIANYSSSSMVSVMWNDGDGIFNDLRTTYTAGSYPNSVAVGDFNDDGKPDIAAASDSNVSVLLNALKGDTLTTLADLPASATYGDTLTLTATVTTDIPGTPAGEVQFKDNGVDLGVPVPLTGDQATYTTGSLAAGDHSLTAEFLANEDYNGSTSDPQTVTVSRTPLTITVEDKDKIYGARFPAFTLSYSGFVNGETSSVLGGQLILITSAHWYDNVGDYPIEADGLTSDNYDITFAPGTLHILPKPLTVTADDKTKVYGDPLPAFTATYSGFVMGQTLSVLSGALSLTTLADQASDAGTYAITPFGLTSTNYAITFADGTLTITPVDTTTMLESSANPSTYGTNVMFTAAVSPSSAGGTVAFKAGGDTITGCKAQAVTGGQATCTISALTAGTHIITAEYSGDTNHNASSGMLLSDQQVDKATATITLGSLTQTYDGTPRSATATTGPAGLTVSFMYNASLTVPTNAGTYTVDAAIIDSNYEGSTSGTLTIEKANVTITFGNLVHKYDGNPKAATFTTDPPGLAVTLTYDGSLDAPSDVGTYTLVGTTSDLNHEGTASDTLTIEKADATVTLGNLSQTYDGTPKSVTVTTNPNGLAVNLFYNGSALPPTNAGTYSVTAVISDLNYQGGASDVLAIMPAPLTITADDKTKIYGDANPAFTANYSGFVSGQDPSVLGGALMLSTPATASSGVGTYSITPSGLTSSNYDITFMDGTLTTDPAPLTIAADDKTKTYGDANPAFTASYNGFVLGQDPSVLGGALVLSTPATSSSSVGTYAITPSGLTSSNYAITFMDGTLTIDPASLIITADDKTKEYGDPNPAFTASYNGFVLGQDPSVLGGTLILSTTAMQSSPVGTYPIAPSGVTSLNYEFTFVNGTLTVVDNTAPTVVSIVRLSSNPTKANAVNFAVTFSEPVIGVNAADFQLATTGTVNGASVVFVSGSGATRTVTVSTGAPGTGTIGLNLTDDDTIKDSLNQPLGGTGTGNGNLTGEVYTVDREPPSVVSITRLSGNPTKATAVNYRVTFSEAVTVVTAADFQLATTGTLSGASIAYVTGTGTTRTVTVYTGDVGMGTLSLTLVDDDTIKDSLNQPLGGTGMGDGSLTGETYTVDRTPPTVVSIAKVDTDPTSATVVHFTVTFTETVFNVDSADFQLALSGISGAAITGITGTGATRTVTVNTGTGSGTLGLNLLDNDTIKDPLGNSLAGAGNGSFTGEVYTVN